MIAGCGNSNMLGDMAIDGYTNLVGADLSRGRVVDHKVIHLFCVINFSCLPPQL